MGQGGAATRERTEGRGAPDVHAVAQLFRAAGIDAISRWSENALSAEAWATRCIRLGLDPHVVIRRILAARAGAPVEEARPRGRPRRTEAAPEAVVQRVVEDLQRLRRQSERV